MMMTITILRDEDKIQLAGVVPDELMEESNMAVCALSEDELCGVMLTKAVRSDTWDVTYAYVLPAWKRQGVATDMLRLIVTVAKAVGVGALTLSLFEDDDERDIRSFAEANGFEMINESPVLSASLSSIEIALGKKLDSKITDGNVVRLKHVSGSAYGKLLDKLGELRHEKKDRASADYYMIPKNRSFYDADVSAVALDEDGEICGILLMREETDFVSVDYMCSLKPEDPRIAMSLLKNACDWTCDKYNETLVHFHAFNPAVVKMTKSLFGRFLSETGKAVYMIRYI